jgi:hypothetical protein
MDLDRSVVFSAVGTKINEVKPLVPLPSCLMTSKQSSLSPNHRLSLILTLVDPP